MASPCISVRASAFRIKRSRVPCKKIRGRNTRIESLYVTRRDCPYVCWNRVVAALECLLDGYRNTGRRAAKLIRRVKRVGRGGRRSHKHTDTTKGPELWRNDGLHAISHA